MTNYPLEWGWHTDPDTVGDPAKPQSPPSKDPYPLEFGWHTDADAVDASGDPVPRPSTQRDPLEYGPRVPPDDPVPGFAPGKFTLLGSATADGGILPVRYDGSSRDVQIAQAPSNSPPISSRPKLADSDDPGSEDWKGFELVLPNGETIQDDFPASRSPTRTVRTPRANLGDVAAAGRRAKEEMQRQESDWRTSLLAIPSFQFDALANVGTGGEYDLQRRGKGNQVVDYIADKLGVRGVYEHRRQFLPIANINVGLYSQQSGLTLDQTLRRAGEFARYFSSNYQRDQPYGLDPRTAHFIKKGYEIGERGLFTPNGPQAPQ